MVSPAGDDAVVHGRDQLRRPREVRIVSTPLAIGHRLAVALDERGISGTHLGRPVSGQDAPDLVDRYRDALHRGRRLDRLGL